MNIKRMDFPQTEQASLTEKLREGTTIYTTRLSAEYDKYSPGDIVTTPLSIDGCDIKLRVEEVINCQLIEQHPFLLELSLDRVRQIQGHRYQVIYLVISQ